MVVSVQAIRGMNDILPDEIYWWNEVERSAEMLAAQFGYREIRFPLVEKTELFKRSVGEVTDIVEKEMYTFPARSGGSLSLRPEGTAGCVRAAVQHGLLNQGAISRLWYSGPMYRHERPQKGRYRQFHQFSLEAFGIASPLIEVEQIAFMWQLFSLLGLTDRVVLELNTLGSSACRARYKTALVDYFEQHKSQLDEDSLRRLETNPLRILDSKNSQMQSLIANAPQFQDYWSDESRQHFMDVQSHLNVLEIPFSLNSRLVRGLDYYSHTVYEWTTTALGAQGTVCAGGRYDKLVTLLGGGEVPAVGFALGMERLILLLQAVRSDVVRKKECDVYCIVVGEKAESKIMAVAQQIRAQLPTLSLVVNLHGGSFKTQFKRADKSGAQYACILGDDEVEQGTVAWKNLRNAAAEQMVLPVTELIEKIKKGEL